LHVLWLSLVAYQLLISCGFLGRLLLLLLSQCVNLSVSVCVYVAGPVGAVYEYWRQLYHHMQQRGIQPTVATYGTLITIASEAQVRGEG